MALHQEDQQYFSEMHAAALDDVHTLYHTRHYAYSVLLQSMGASSAGHQMMPNNIAKIHIQHYSI